MPRGGKRPGAGRPKGSRNKTSAVDIGLTLTEMILQALADVGGVAYLEAHGLRLSDADRVSLEKRLEKLEKLTV
jgi:hypothetical protein